jgi:sulfite oxidase
MLVARCTEPFNAEPESSALVEFQLTPEELFYCRNHGPVKDLDEEQYTVIVNGGVSTELKLSLHDLRGSFEKVEVVAALQVVILIGNIECIITDTHTASVQETDVTRCQL